MDSSSQAAERQLSPQIQQLDSTIKKMQAGELTLEAFGAYLEQYADRLRMLDLPHLEGTDRGDRGVAEAMSHHQFLTQQYRQGLEMLIEYTQDRDEKKLEQGYQTMVNADTLLLMMFEEIRKRHDGHLAASEASAWIVCPRCSHKNRRGTPSCGQCRFMLPQVVDVRQETDIIGGDTSGAVAEAVVAPLFSLGQAWQQNGDPAPLLEKLRSMHDNYVAAAQKTRDMLETQSQQLYPEVKAVMAETEQVLYQLADLVSQAFALVSADNFGGFDQPIIEIRDTLNELGHLRVRFGELARQYSPRR
ncbi:MAG: hypothetical protein ACYCW6_00610 [Candidatus Xenobia bacterium]